MPGAYEVSCNIATAGAAAAIATITTAAGQQARILEIGVSSGTATAAEIGLGVPAAVGVGALTGPVFQPLDPSDVAGVTTLVNGSTNRGFATSAPTVPTNPFRRFELAGVIGSGIVWVWGDNQLVIPVSKQIVIWQYSSVTITFSVYVKLMGG
jgi:hypothetical protein